MDLSGGLDLYHVIGLERQYQGITVRGINTAATIWCASAVGVLAGLGFIAWAALVAFLVVLANVLLHICEHVLFGSKEDPVAR